VATIQTKIGIAIQNRVASLPGSFPVLWTDDAPASPPVASGQPAPYIEAHHEPNRTVRRFLGSTDPHERPGLLLLTLCWPLAKVGTGSGKTHKDAIREIAGKIAEHFPADLCMPFQGVSVRVTGAPSVLGSYRDDHYMRTQVRVTYQAFA
jgi:hypothetical protein